MPTNRTSAPSARTRTQRPGERVRPSKPARSYSPRGTRNAVGQQTCCLIARTRGAAAATALAGVACLIGRNRLTPVGEDDPGERSSDTRRTACTGRDSGPALRLYVRKAATPQPARRSRSPPSQRAWTCAPDPSLQRKTALPSVQKARRRLAAYTRFSVRSVSAPPGRVGCRDVESGRRPCVQVAGTNLRVEV